jgi:hypothetical protein
MSGKLVVINRLAFSSSQTECAIPQKRSLHHFVKGMTLGTCRLTHRLSPIYPSLKNISHSTVLIHLVQIHFSKD